MSSIRDVWKNNGKGLPGPRFSDLIFTWLEDQIGTSHEINVAPSFVSAFANRAYSIRIDGILVGWVDDVTCEFQLASGDTSKVGEVRRRPDLLKAADPLLFVKIWERMHLIDEDCKVSNGYSITAYRK